MIKLNLQGQNMPQLFDIPADRAQVLDEIFIRTNAEVRQKVTEQMLSGEESEDDFNISHCMQLYIQHAITVNEQLYAIYWATRISVETKEKVDKIADIIEAIVK